MSHRILNWALAGAIVLLYAAVQQLDGIDSHSEEMAVAASISDAQKQAAEETKRDLAAARLCRESHGNSGYQWTADGELVCVPRKRKS